MQSCAGVLHPDPCSNLLLQCWWTRAHKHSKLRNCSCLFAMIFAGEQHRVACYDMVYKPIQVYHTRSWSSYIILHIKITYVTLYILYTVEWVNMYAYLIFNTITYYNYITLYHTWSYLIILCYTISYHIIPYHSIS